MFFSKKSSEIWLVVGLGNPGLEYANTRHNAGFLAADKIAEKYNVAFNKHKFDAVFGEFNLKGNKVLLAKPQTYMNNSGKAVSAIAKFYKIPNDRIIIMFDDISLDIGKLRMRRKGSHGGHNGIKDIIALLGTDEIMRVKIGVGERENKDYDLKDWVLSKFPKEKQADLKKALENTSTAVTEIITNGIDYAMNNFNS